MYSFKPITEIKLYILDHANTYKPFIIDALKKYKQRWGESLATNLVVINHPSEIQPGIPIIVTNYYFDELPTQFAKAITVDTLGQLTHYHLRQAVLTTTTTYTQCPVEAQQWLNSLPSIFAYDCETASNYSDEETMQLVADLTDQPLDAITKKQVADIGKHHFDDLAVVQPTLSKISSNALVAQKNQFTMFSFSADEQSAFVIDANPQTIPVVLNFLTSTNSKVIMHNALFDAKLIHWQTGKHIKNIIDTQLMWAVILNHVDTFRAKVGLKTLAGTIYGAWAVAKDLFGIENKYNTELIEYAGVDAMATFHLYHEALLHPDFQWKKGESHMPLDQVLPIHHPSILDKRQSRRFFYENVLNHLIRPMIKMMNNGIYMDMDKVYQLDQKLDAILAKVESDLLANSLVESFNRHRYAQFETDYITDRKSKLRLIDHYFQSYKPGDMQHRSYLIEHLRTIYQFQFQSGAILPDGSPKWDVKQTKLLLTHIAHGSALHPILEAIINKEPIDPAVTNPALNDLAQAKADKYNQSYLDDIDSVSIHDLPKFNPGSAPMKSQLFEFLNIPCESETKTGADSWNKDELKRLQSTTTEPTLLSLVDALVEFSSGAIIKRNFVKGFINYPIDSILYGSIKLMGTKTA